MTATMPIYLILLAILKDYKEGKFLSSNIEREFKVELKIKQMALLHKIEKLNENKDWYYKSIKQKQYIS